MQNIPRINMISLDLKESNETPDFSPLYNYIERHYNENSDNYKESFKELINLRQTSISGIENLNCLASMKRYFSQLQLLKTRFPLSASDDCAVTWNWEDSNSNTTVTLSDIRFEEASILYNIGCLHCNLGAKESRIDLDSTKIACTHFQCSAWAFQTILDKFTPLSVAELECDLLRFLNLLMLAEAHECVLEKSMVDQRRAGITAKIAFQISDFYKQCQGLLKSENIGFAVNSRHYKIWKRTCVLKEHLYFGLSYYYTGLLAEESNKYGEIVAWMKLAKEKIEKCNKPLKELKNGSCDETIKFVQDIINGKLESSTKDNNFIYYDKVPEPDMLPPIKGAMLLKGIAFDVNDPDICGKDIFRNLIPMETHFSSSVYSEKKAEILRNIQADIEQKNEEIEQFLNNIQWNSDTLSLLDLKAPQELFNCAAFVSANSDILTTLKNTMQDISSISIEVEESLEILSEKMRTIKVGKSSQSWESLEEEYSEFVNNFEDAKESNNQLRDAFACTLSDFNLVLQPMEVVISGLPSLKEFVENKDVNSLIGESRRLLDKVEEMKTQRSDFLQQLKSQLMNDDLTQLLLGSKYESESNKVIEEGLKKHDELINYLKQNMSAQTKIMDAIVEHNAKIAEVKSEIVKVKEEREKVVNRIVRSFNLYKSILKKGEEGISFYRKLSDRIAKFQKDTDKLIPQKPVELKQNDPISVDMKPADVKQSLKLVAQTNMPLYNSNITKPVNPQSVSVPYEMHDTSLQPTQIKPLRLKDYLIDRKKNATLKENTEITQPMNPLQEPVSQGNMNLSQYQYTPWGFYGPPSGQTSYTPNYSISKCKAQDSEFRTTQNVYLPTPLSEVGADHSVYLNYSSLPRTNYSSYSNAISSVISSAASIGNLSSNTSFTIPYQHNSFASSNVISMAHGFCQAGIPEPQNKSYSEFERHQYCSYPYTHELKDSQYFSQYPGSYIDTGYAQNMQHTKQCFPPYLQASQPIQTGIPYPGVNNIQTHAFNESKFSSSDNNAPHSFKNQSDMASYSQNQYSDSRNINQNMPKFSEYYLNTSLSGYQQGHYPTSSESDKNKCTPTYPNQDNCTQAKSYKQSFQNSDNQQNFVSKQTQPPPKFPAEKSIFPPSSFPNKTSFNYSNTHHNTPSLKSDKKSNTTDLLSSSPTNAFKQDNNIAVLEPKILTKEEIEDQKEEKRKQIYHKQHSGLKHPLNDHLILNRFIADAERFLKKINEFLDPNNNQALEQHWNHLIDKEKNLPKKSTAIAKCSPMKNRMQDSVPYDENRVIIKDGKDDYINASHILLQNIDECVPRFITCQSPLANTVSEFWTAIFEQGCEILVQLACPCSADDTSKSRVVGYWPDPKSKSLSVGSKFEIYVQSFKEKSNWNERILLVKSLKTNQSRSVWHFQVNNVSNKLPKSLDEFLAFEIELCRYYRQQRSLTKPIGVSCINGSSVSGVFIMLTAALLQMEITGIFPDIDSILLAMWPQRKGILDDKHQLAFVYKAISKASSDMLSKRNIVIGPGRVSASVHSTTVSEHQPHSPLTASNGSGSGPHPSTSSIIDSIFTNQHLQLSDLDSVLSKWTVKPDDGSHDIAKPLVQKQPSQIDQSSTASIDSVISGKAAAKEIQLPSTLSHLQDPASIDFTPTPTEKRRITKKEFEAKMNKTYVQQPAVSTDNGTDPLKSLDPLHQL